jgi:hypothetical protein
MGVKYLIKNGISQYMLLHDPILEGVKFRIWHDIHSNNELYKQGVIL